MRIVVYYLILGLVIGELTLGTLYYFDFIRPSEMGQMYWQLIVVVSALIAAAGGHLAKRMQSSDQE